MAHHGSERFQLRNILTIVLGTLVMASSYQYMTLKMGITPGMSIVSGLLAFLFIVVLFRRKGFTALENNLVQTSMTAGTSIAFMCAALAAMDMMGIELHPVAVFLWLTCTGSLGVLMAVPLRRQFVEVEAERLPFPDAVATATTLKVLEDPTGSGAQQAKMLGGAGVLAAIFAWARDVWTWIPGSIFGTPYMLGLESSVMMFGSGVIIGLRVCLWMIVASLLTWGVLAPWLVESGIGLATAKTFGMEDAFAKQAYYPVIMRWTMWPATTILVVGGLTALIVRWRLFVDAFRSFANAARSRQEDELSLRTVLFGIVCITLVLAVLQQVVFGVHPVYTVLSVVLSVPLMIVGIRAYGETNIGPVSIMGSMMQMVFGVIAPGNTVANMATSATTGSIAAESQDVTMDMKIGKILGSSPRRLSLAQFLGIPLGALSVAVVLPILKQAYGYGGEHGLPAPTAFKWKAFAELLTRGLDALPPGVGVAVVLAAIAGVLFAVLERRWPKWTPSAMGIGVAMLLPSQIVVMIAIGGVVGWIWMRQWRNSAGTYMVPLASGLIAGEATAAVVIPILRILGVLGGGGH